MTGMTRVWERLYVGGRDDAEHLFKSNPHGITTVLSLCEDQVLRRKYLHIPVFNAKRLGVGQLGAIIDAIGENIRWGTVVTP